MAEFDPSQFLQHCRCYELTSLLVQDWEVQLYERS